MVSITDIKKSKSAPKQVQTKSLPRGVSIDVIKNSRFKKPETPSFSMPRSFSEKYTINKSTATPNTAVDDFVKQNTSKTVLSGASTKFTDYAKTQQFKKDNITDIADVNGYIDTISYNYISSTPVAKLKEDKNNSDIGSAVIYEAVTGSPGKGTIEEIKLAAEKNRGITPKINYYTDSLKLFGNDVDNAINKFGEYEDLYKKAIIEVGNDGKLTAETDEKVKDAITTLRGTGIKAANEGERTIAEEYAMLFDNVKNGDAANYAAMKFVQGFTSGPIGQIGGLVQDAGDAGAAISGSKSTSDIVHKIEKYIAENPTKKTEIQRGGNFKIALEMGVSLSDIQNYNMITMNKQMGDHAETNFGNYVDENYKKYVGGTAENIGRFAYATLMGAAMGGSSAVGNNHSGLISNIANKSGFKKTVKDLFTYTPQTVQYGLTTYASERASAAADHGFDAKDIFVAAAKGFAESTSENIGGVEDIKWFSDISAKKGLGKVVFNHFVSTGEEILEEEFNNVAQNIIDKTFVDQDKKWFGGNGVFDPQEMADTAVSSFLFGEIVGSVKLATDIASEVKSGKRYNAEAKRLLNSISKSIPEEYRPDISKDDVDSATKKIVSAQLEHLKLVDDSIADKSETNKAITGIMNSAIKSAALGGTTKQAMLDNMSEQGYTPSAVIESKTVGANLSEETARAVNEVTDKLDAAFASAWYGSDGVAAGRVAASVYVRAAAIGDAVSALKLASDVASGKIKGKAADKALRKAAALLPGSARIDISAFVSASENAVNIINAAEGYIVSLNENTAAISQDYSEDLIDAINRAVEGKEFVVEREHRSAIIDMILNGNLDNLNTILSDQYATQLLADILGMEITEKTDLATIKRKVRDMINTYRAGQGKGFDSISAQKKRRIKDIMKRLSDLKAEKTAIDGFRNAILNGKLTKEQAVAIASDVDIFDLYSRVTAGRLGANPTIDDMIKAAGYVAGFDLSGDFSPYYDNGYTNTVESDTLVTGDEVGIYDPSTGTVTLNKKAPLDKKLAYRLARLLVNASAFADNPVDTYDNFVPNNKVIQLVFDGDQKESVSLSSLPRECLKAIGEFLKTDVSEYTCNIERRVIPHIRKRHGKNGKHDKSMTDASNIGRVEFALMSPDEISYFGTTDAYWEYRDKKNRKANTFLLEKSIGKKSCYVVLAVPVAKAKKTYVVSTFIGAPGYKKEVPQPTDAKNPGATSKIGTGYTSIYSIQKQDKNVNSLINNILTYMLSHGYTMGSERDRVVKKFNPYLIEHRSRLNSSLLSEDNLNREIVSDFLTNIFTDSAAMEKLADNDLDLAVDLAERVKAYADTATDKQMKDFANDVCKRLITVIRFDERADELQAILHNRTQNGIDSPALYDSIDKGRIDFSERDEGSAAAKVKDWYNNLKRGFVDSGEAIARLGKLLDNETIYHKYNNTKQSRDAIAYMLEKAQTDIEGNKIGKSLKDVFKLIIADKGKYEKFCLYMQYINNAERAVNGKAIFSDMTKEQSLERAESLLRSNPEFEAWADDVYKYNEGLMSWLIDSGLLTRDQYDEMKKQNPHYVPAFIVDNTKHDKPSFIESVVVKKTVKRAKGGAEEVMPLLDAMQMKTAQIIKEARMNMLALEIVDTMKRKDLLEDGPKGFTVKDPAFEEFIYQITAVRDSKYYEPTKVNGKYVTVNTNRKLKDDIKDLFSFADGKKNEARNIVSEYVRKLTYSETFVASDAEALAQELIDRAISPGANADALYYQYPELRADLANAKLYVPPETVSEIPDYSDFKNSLFGRVTLTTREGDGTHVDTAYTIWAGAYPELFDPDITNTTDQLYKIKEVIENLKKPPEVTLKQMHGKNIGAVKAELTDNIKRLSIQAVKDAHSERAEIEKDVEAHAFATYEIGSTNNLEFAKGEQDGNRMVFYADGIRHTMDIGKGVFEGLKNISFDPDAKTALKPVQKLNDGFKKLVTSYNPFFSVRNFIRDLQDAVMYSSDTKRMLRNLPRAYKEIATNGEMWQLYQSLGGVGSSYFDFKKQIDLETDMSTKSKATRAYKRMSGVVEQINVAVEQAPRLAEFITVLEKSDGSYAAKLKALYAAADVTVNFGRSGIYSRFLNSTVVPFYNPGVQGLSRFVRMFSEKKGTKQLIILSAKLVVLGFAVGGINDLLNAIWEAANDEEDETYDQLTDYQKQNNILIPIGDGRYIKIPKGRSLNVFGIGAQNVIDMVQGEDVDWIGSIKTAAGQISPNDPFTDNLVAPLIAAGNNRTWYGSSIESAADEQVDPSQRYDETTDYFSRWLGEVLNYSPKKIHYVLDAYTGVVGDYVLPILTPKGGGNIFENVAMTAGSNFLVDGTTSNRVSSDYYSRIDELTYEKNDTSGADVTSATVALRFMNSQTKAIRDFYAEIQKVNSGDLSPNEKAEKSRELKATLNGIMLNAMASEQEVYKAAKNIKSKYAYEKDGTYYNEIGEELTEEAYIDIIYREVNREVFGTEYALQVYGADTYKSAAEAVNNGATYDLYYNAYFGTKNIEGDYDPDKGRDKTGTARLNKWAEIDKLDASRSEKVALARTLFKIDDEEIKEAQDIGVDLYDYINFLCNTGVMSSGVNLTKKDKVLSYINRMQISRKEKDAFYLLAGYSEKTLSDAPWR